MQALFQGTIGFGLVAIPVQLYKAFDEEKVAMHWLHQPCQHRIQYRKYCPHCQREVDNTELVKATEWNSGQYVVLGSEVGISSPDRSIGVLSFHSLHEVDPIYFHSAYWVKPKPEGAKAYHLLARTLDRLKLAALAEMRLRQRLQLALVRPYQAQTLVLHGLYYPEGLRRDGAEFGRTDTEISPKEAQLATRLVQQLREPFDPQDYPNRERHAFTERIREAAAHGAVSQPGEPLAASMQNLIEQLQASLEANAAVSHGG